MVRYNSKGRLVTSLARAWSHNKDYTKWSFELQRHVLFHDGAEFTADDVIFTFRNLKVQNIGVLNQLFDNIQFVQKDNKWRVTFILKRPTVDFLHYLAIPEAVIVNTFTWRKNTTKPQGTGPYVYALNIRGQRLELSSNNAYWGEKPQIDKVVFHFNKTPENIKQGLQSGVLDGVWGIEDPLLIPKIMAPNVKIHSMEGAGVLSLIINQGDGALIHQSLRRAIKHALNPKVILESVYGGYGKLTHGVVKSFGKMTLDKPKYDYDPEQTMDILSRSGYAQSLSLRLSVLDRPDLRKATKVITHQLAKVGIVTVVDYIPLHQWYQKIHIDKDYEIALTVIRGGSTILDYRSPNLYNYEDHETNRLVQSVIASPNQHDKMTNLKSIQEKVVDNVTTIPLLELDYISLFDKSVKGIWQTKHCPQLIIDEIRIQ